MNHLHVIVSPEVLYVVLALNYKSFIPNKKLFLANTEETSFKGELQCFSTWAIFLWVLMISTEETMLNGNVNPLHRGGCFSTWQVQIVNSIA